MIDNTPVGGVRPVSTIQIRFATATGADTINIRGFFFRADNASKFEFISEAFPINANIAANSVLTRNYNIPTFNPATGLPIDVNSGADTTFGF